MIRLVRQCPMSPKQAAFCRLVQDHISQIIGFVAGRGSGKTEIGAITLCMSMRNGEPWMVVSPDNNVIRETTWPTFERVARRLGVWLHGVKSPTPRAFVRTYDGGEAEVVFKGAEVPDKLRGASKAGLWFDELSVISQEAFLYALPVLRWKGQMGSCLATFTPKGRRHWSFGLFYKEADRQAADWYYSLVERVGHDGAAAETGLTQICETVYRSRAGASLIMAATWDNPFRPRGYEQLLASQYTSLFAEQELAGKFVDLEGTMFRREWFRWTDRAPSSLPLRIRYWDLADTDAAGCWTVGTLLGQDDSGNVWVEDVVRGQWSAGTRDRMIVETAQTDQRRYANDVVVYVEQEPGSGGKHQATAMIRTLSMLGVPVYRDIPKGARYKSHEGEKIPGLAKIIRARPASAATENGLVTLVRGNWTTEFLAELQAFPHSAHCDQVDSFAAGFNQLRQRQSHSGGEIGTMPPAGATRIREARPLDRIDGRGGGGGSNGGGRRRY